MQLKCSSQTLTLRTNKIIINIEDSSNIKFLNNLESEILKYRHSSNSNLCDFFFNGLGEEFEFPIEEKKVDLINNLNLQPSNKYEISLSYPEPRSFAIYGFSRLYTYDTSSFIQYPYPFETSDYYPLNPKFRTPIFLYKNILNNTEIITLDEIIKKQILKKLNIASPTEGDDYVVKRELDVNKYDILPSVSLKYIIYLIESFFFEGYGYKDEMFEEKLNSKEYKEAIIKSKYSNVPSSVKQLVVAENLSIRKDSIQSPYYLTNGMYNWIKDCDKDNILYFKFKYRAIGLNYTIEENNDRIVWMKYEDFIRILEEYPENINTELLEAIFTKNLFDTLGINNKYWSK